MEQQAKVVEDPRENRFEIRVGDERAGLVDYRRRGTELSFLHTEIDPRFEGRGLGAVLVGGALDAAREQGLSVLPYCPFVRRYIQRHPEYLDLVPARRRAGFELPAPEADPSA